MRRRVSQKPNIQIPRHAPVVGHNVLGVGKLRHAFQACMLWGSAVRAGSPMQMPEMAPSGQGVVAEGTAATVDCSATLLTPRPLCCRFACATALRGGRQTAAGET